MRALLYEQFQGPIELEQVKDPAPLPHGVVVQVKASGLCLSDWHGWMGHDKDIRLPHVPGHELAGVVVEVGKDVKNFQKGDRVTVPFVAGCGDCPQCHTGNQQICDNQFQPGFTGWGSFAEYVALSYSDENLVRLPEEVSFGTAASLGCRFATSFRAVVDQGKVQPEQWVAVHGCGGVGLSAIMIAKALDARVIAIDINDEALATASSLGADIVINAAKENVSQKILSESDGGVHVSLDALGNSEILKNSITSLRKRGKHIQVGILPPKTSNASVPTDLFISKELELIGSHGMQAHRYEEMMSMILEGKLQPERLLSSEHSLEEAASLLPALNKRDSSGIQIVTQFE